MRETTDAPPHCTCGYGVDAGPVGMHGVACAYANWRIANGQLASRRLRVLDKAYANGWLDIVSGQIFVLHNATDRRDRASQHPSLTAAADFLLSQEEPSR